MKKAFHMDTTKYRELGGLLSGVFLGGLAGFLAMLLFAPRSGESTRASILQTSAQLQDRAVDTFDELVILSQFDNRRILIETRA
jgi:gas vesicle protein